MQSDLSETPETCTKRGNDFPFCLPKSTDVWMNGSSHHFIWNYNHPYYVGYAEINLYLYYMVKFEYVNIKSFLNLDRSTGELSVTIDDTWFLNKLEPGSSDQNLTIFGFYVPSILNSTQELSSPDSMLPRPFNFTITQTAPPGNGTNTNSTNTPTNNNNNSNSENNNGSNLYSSPLPGWAIAVIVLAVVALVCGGAALIWAIILSRRNKRNNKLIPIARRNNNDSNEKRDYRDTVSINSQAKMTAFRSTDSVPMTTASAAENASSVGSLASRRTYAQQPLSPAYDANSKLSSSDAVLLADTFRNTLGRSTADWNNSVTIGDEQEEELKRRRLGEALLQRQLEEDGTSVKHAGRFTRVKSLADIQKSAVFEQPKY